MRGYIRYEGLYQICRGKAHFACGAITDKRGCNRFVEKVNFTCGVVIDKRGYDRFVEKASCTCGVIIDKRGYNRFVKQTNKLSKLHEIHRHSKG